MKSNSPDCAQKLFKRVAAPITCIEAYILYPHKGNRYKGPVNKENLEPQGEGLLTFDNGNWVRGLFDDGGLVSGYGCIRDPDGTTYEGALNGNLEQHGEGVVIFDNGDWVQGIFDNGRFLSGRGSIKDPDGTTYLGGFNENQMPHGQGMMIYPNGDVDIVLFNDGEMVDLLPTNTISPPLNPLAG